MIRLSIIIPLYNEAEGINSLNQQLRPVLNDLAKEYDVELILVDDGSRDDTYPLLVKKFSNFPAIQFLRHETNRNLGAALQTGLRKASGDIVCTMDSDCSYEPGLLIEMLRFLKNGNYDLVTASPYHPAGMVRGVAKRRLFLSNGLSCMYRMVLPFKLYCYTSMFRLYRSEVISSVSVQSSGFLAVTEILVKAGLKGFRVGEMPATLFLREHGLSKARVGMMIADHLGFIAKIVLTRCIPARLKSVVPGRNSLFLHG